MKKLLNVALLFAIPVAPVIADNLEQQRIKESRKVIKTFAAALKKELKSALHEGGAIQAIAICSTVAPAIAKQQSAEHGWQIGRTSLKLRNPENAPDEWEKMVLKKFEQRKKAGEDPAKMEFFETVEQNGRKLFRYMKAIPTAEKPCLTCHGSNLSSEVKEALDKRYPQDKARGFKAGDIRGAFTITQPIQ